MFKKIQVMFLVVFGMSVFAFDSSPNITADISFDNLSTGEAGIGRLSLYDNQINAPVTYEDLQEVHTEKVHLLIINERGDDYHHIHPKPTDIPGEYVFHMTPNTDDAYRIWVDVATIEHGSLDYFYTDVLRGKDSFIFNLPRHDEFKLFNYGDLFVSFLSFMQDEIIADRDVMGKIVITDEYGLVVDNLQPIMGAYAHIVGFYDDGESIAHIHPHGKPEYDEQLASGILNFHFGGPKPGYLRLYNQVKINNEEHFSSFDVFVKSSD